jgi:hypothetical protein
MKRIVVNPPESWGKTLVHGMWPFWLFKDANQGDLFARAAANAHNRRMSEILPVYLQRWLLVCVLASASLYANDALATEVAGRVDVFALIAAGSGLVCASGICAMLVIGYAWCYLRLGKH